MTIREKTTVEITPEYAASEKCFSKDAISIMAEQEMLSSIDDEAKSSQTLVTATRHMFNLEKYDTKVHYQYYIGVATIFLSIPFGILNVPLPIRYRCIFLPETTDLK